MLLRESRNRLQLSRKTGPAAQSDSLLRLEVPVNDMVPMTVFYCADHLLEEAPRFGLAHLKISLARIAF